MTAEACAIGRIGPDGPWVGFARGPAGEHLLAVGSASGVRAAPVPADALLALAIAYFEDVLDPPPDELAATHADIGELVRALASREPDVDRRRTLEEAMDAIDDGLAADAVIRRLGAALRSADADEAVAGLTARALALAGND